MVTNVVVGAKTNIRVSTNIADGGLGNNKPVTVKNTSTIVSNVIVGRKRNVRVSSNTTAGVLDTTTPVTLKNTPTIISGGVERLDSLKDVNAVNETNGAVPVYDSNLDKYIVKKLDLSTDVIGDLDGGSF